MHKHIHVSVRKSMTKAFCVKLSEALFSMISNYCIILFIDYSSTLLFIFLIHVHTEKSCQEVPHLVTSLLLHTIYPICLNM